MERLLASVAPPNQCFSYAHPWVEDAGGGGRTAEFSNGDLSRFVPVPDGFLGEVSRISRSYLHSCIVRHTFIFVHENALGLSYNVSNSYRRQMFAAMLGNGSAFP